MYFTQLNFPLYYNLKHDLDDLIANRKCDWKLSQICLNSTAENLNDNEFGCGSLVVDWSNFNNVAKEQTLQHKKIKAKEEDFKYLCNQFKNTELEEIYNFITSKFAVGRVRIIKNLPHSCLSWHKDTTKRLHYPIKTNEKCLMVIDSEAKHLPINSWWMADTLNYHTAFNGSLEERIHIVASVL